MDETKDRLDRLEKEVSLIHWHLYGIRKVIRTTLVCFLLGLLTGLLGYIL